MKKRFIALFLTLLMILTSVNISFAATVPETIPESQSGALDANGKIYTTDWMPDTYMNGNRFGIINFDLTNYLPMLYLAKTVKLKVTSGTFSGSTNPFAIEIIPDSKEIYTDFNHNYAQAVAGGVLSDGTQIWYKESVLYDGNSQSSDDIKNELIKALESGNNNNLSLRLVAITGNVTLRRGSELLIEYDDAVVSDEAYYKAILESFKLKEIANVDLDNITSDFTLPTFFKGSNITWTSGNANVIAVSSDGTASVTKPEDNDEKVTLTANFSYKEASNYLVKFEANVVKKSELEKIADKFNSTYKVSDEDYNAITKDLKLDKTFEGATLSWVSSNEDVIKAETGRVIRSKTEDVQVELTPTILYNGESIILNSINVTVKKIISTPGTIPEAQSGSLLSDGRILTTDWKPDTYINGARFGIINFDLTEYLPRLYLANTVKLKVESGNSSANKYFSFALEIIPDSKEIYTDFNHTYSQAVAGGVLTDGIEIFSSAQIGSYNTVHTSSDIKDALIKALESGDNNNLSLRLVASDGNVALERGSELLIEYDESVVSDKAYYEKISKDFDLESIANIDLASVKSDFTLPTFFKGSNITWTSGNANVISVSSDGTASVTRLASGDETVTLTATFSYKDGSSYVKTFEATVPEINVPVIEEVKNNDGSFSAIIKSNEDVNENYTLYFASYTTDNTLVGLCVCPVKGLTEGTTSVDAKEFLTNGATKIKCILLKGNTLTPACKNGEVPNN